MRIKTKHTLLDIRVLFAAVVTLMLLADSKGIAALALAACVLHECGHIICLIVLGDYPYRITLSFFGMRIERRSKTGVSRKNEILIAIVGPLVNFIIFAAFAAFDRFKIMAQANLLVGIFNSLPCLPLDGGSILFNALAIIKNEQTAHRVCRITSVATLCVMAACSMPLLIFSKNFTLLAVTIYLAIAIKTAEKYIV